jgi:hypothetical protein
MVLDRTLARWRLSFGNFLFIAVVSAAVGAGVVAMHTFSGGFSASNGEHPGNQRSVAAPVAHSASAAILESSADAESGCAGGCEQHAPHGTSHMEMLAICVLALVAGLELFLPRSRQSISVRLRAYAPVVYLPMVSRLIPCGPSLLALSISRT